MGTPTAGEAASRGGGESATAGVPVVVSGGGRTSVVLGGGTSGAAGGSPGSRTAGAAGSASVVGQAGRAPGGAAAFPGSCAAPRSLAAEATVVDSAAWRVDGSLVEAGSSLSGSCGGEEGAEVAYHWTADEDSWVQVRVTGEDPVVYVRRNCNDGSTEIACNDDAIGLDSVAYFRAAAGEVYAIVVDSWGPDFDSRFELTVDARPASSLSLPSGAWLSRGYGLALAVRDDSVSAYELSEVSCIRYLYGPPGMLEEDYESARHPEEDVLELVAHGATGVYGFDRVDALPPRCEGTGTPVLGHPDYEPDPLLAFDVFAQTFAEQYAFFELRGVDWPALVEEQRGHIHAQSSDEELFEVLGELASALHDGHVGLSNGDETIESAYSEGTEILYEEFMTEGGQQDFWAYAAEQRQRMKEVTDSYLQPPTGNTGDIATWGMLRDDVAYLRIQNFDLPPDLASELGAGVDTILARFASVDNLVLDIRRNGGGYDWAGMTVASRFADEHTLVLVKSARDGTGETAATPLFLDPAPVVYPGRVWVLVGPDTASAAETFTIMMRELPRVTVLGRPTMGILSDILVRTLPNGWHFGLSNELYRTPDGELFEEVGVSPDISLPGDVFTLENRTAGIDQGLEDTLDYIAEHSAGVGGP